MNGATSAPWRSFAAGVNKSVKSRGAVSLDFSGTAADSGEAVDFELYSRNVDHLKAAAQEIKKRLSTYPGLFDIKDSAPRGKAEIKLVLKPMAGNLGVTTSDLAIQVRPGVLWTGSTDLPARQERSEKSWLRYPKDERRSLYSLHNMTIRTETGVAVRLDDVADVFAHHQPGPWWNVFNGRRVLHVTASVDKNLQEPGKVIGEMTAEWPARPDAGNTRGLQFDLGGEAREQRETLSAHGAGRRTGAVRYLCAHGRPAALLSAADDHHVGHPLRYCRRRGRALADGAAGKHPEPVRHGGAFRCGGQRQLGHGVVHQ